MSCHNRPPMGPRDALLRVARCGVCGSDPILFFGQHKLSTPTILGHEIVGTIAEIGPEAEQIHGVKEGDSVVVEFGLGCGGDHRSGAAGASRIVVCGLSKDADRLRFSRWLGATDLSCVDEVDPVEAVEELTDGEMARVVVDVSGSPQRPTLVRQLPSRGVKGLTSHFVRIAKSLHLRSQQLLKLLSL